MNEMTEPGRDDGRRDDTLTNAGMTSNGLKGLWYPVETILAGSAKADRDLSALLELAR
jgi:hypothetical protein